MTVSTTASVKVYTGDNSTTAFSFPYLFYSNSHLKVYLDGVLKTITTHYTVTGAESPAGGTVTFITAPGTDVEIVIQRIAPTTQETDLENFDGNPADVTEKQFDLLAMVDQQLTEQVARTILAPIGTTLTTNTISGDITATNKILLISTAGPTAAAIADVDTSLDAVFTSLANGDMIQYNGTNWVNIAGLPTLGAADTVLQVNAGGTALEYGKVTASNADIASQAEAEAGTNTTKLVTPERVAQAIAALAASGIPVSRTVSSTLTFAASDNGKQIIHPAADTTPRTWTIDSNANLPLDVGTAITIRNQNSAGALTIAITSDTLRLAGSTSTGSRTIAAGGVATIVKEGTTEWYIMGTGVT